MSTSSRSRGSTHADPATPSRLYFATVDGRGRLPVRAAADAVGWAPGQEVGLTVEDDVLRLSDVRGAFIPAEGATDALDDGRRVTIPEDVGARTGLLPGVRVVLLATVDRGLVVVPMFRLLRKAG